MLTFLVLFLGIDGDVQEVSPSQNTASWVFLGLDFSITSLQEEANRPFDNKATLSGKLGYETQSWVFTYGYAKSNFEEGTHSRFKMDFQRHFLTASWKYKTWLWLGVGPGYTKIRRDQSSSFPHPPFFTKDENKVYGNVDLRFQPLSKINLFLALDFIDKDSQMFHAGVGVRFRTAKER